MACAKGMQPVISPVSPLHLRYISHVRMALSPRSVPVHPSPYPYP